MSEAPIVQQPDPEGSPVPLWDDPCAAYKKYRLAYDALVMGEKIAKTEYHGNGVERHVEFNVASQARLKEEMDRAFDQCVAKTGGAPRRRRFAMQGGATRGFAR